MTKRVRGWSVQPADLFYVLLIIGATALMWNAQAIAALAYKTFGKSTAVGAWTLALVFFAWVVLSVVGCWGLLTEKRSYRAPGAPVADREKESV